MLINGHEPCPEGFTAPNDMQMILDCCGEKACYVILPVDRPLSQADILGGFSGYSEKRRRCACR